MRNAAPRFRIASIWCRRKIFRLALNRSEPLLWGLRGAHARWLKSQIHLKVKYHWMDLKPGATAWVPVLVGYRW